MKVISNYMKNKKVNQELQYQVKQYLNYYWREESSQDVQQENKIINQLSNGLRETLLMEANKLALIDSPIFRENFSPQVIIKTIPLIQEMRFTPEEIIFDEDKIDYLEGAIYFIEKGKVEICSYYSHPIVKRQQMVNKIIELKGGDSFGQISFFTGKKRIFSVRSLDFCRLLVIKRQDFIQLLQEYPDDYEKFCMIKDNILQYNDTSIIQTRCYACKSSSHLISECPYIHFLPNRNNIFILENKVMQNRTDFNRRKKYSQIDLSELLEGAVEILDKNKDIIMQNFENNYMIQTNSYHDVEEEELIEDEIDQQIQPNNKQNIRNNQIVIQNPKISSLVSIGQKFEGEPSFQPQQQNIINTELKIESIAPTSQISQNFNNQESQLRINSNLFSNLNNPQYLENTQNRSCSKLKRGSQLSQITSQNSIKIQNLEDQPQRSSISLGDQIIHEFHQANNINNNNNNCNSPQNTQKNYNEEINYFASQKNRNQKLIQNGKQINGQVSSQNQIIVNSSQKIRSSQQIIAIPQGLNQFKINQTSNQITSEREIPIQQLLTNILKIQKHNSLVSNQQKDSQQANLNTNNQYENVKHILNYLDQLGFNKYDNQLSNIEFAMESFKNYVVYFPYNNLQSILVQINAQYTKLDQSRKVSISSNHHQQVMQAMNKVNNNLKSLRRKSIFNQNQFQTFMQNNQNTKNLDNQKTLGSKKKFRTKTVDFNIEESNTKDQKQIISKLSNELSLNQSNTPFGIEFNKNQINESYDQEKMLVFEQTNITSDSIIPIQNINILNLKSENVSYFQQYK